MRNLIDAISVKLGAWAIHLRMYTLPPARMRAQDINHRTMPAIEVWVDGKHYRWATAYDTEEGWVEFYQQDIITKRFITNRAGDEILREKRYGAVEARWVPRLEPAKANDVLSEPTTGENMMMTGQQISEALKAQAK